MQIEILQLLEGARKAKGLTVIIDVFRAFSVACYAFDAGVQRIIPVGDIELALKLKADHPDYLLVGERKERMPEGFDFGNSPTLLKRDVLKGKIMVHTTSAGTQGIAAATGADELITGSFVNAGAIVKYIQFRSPSVVSLVCMGYACKAPSDEDTFLAEYLKACLEDQPVDLAGMKSVLKTGAGARFFASEKQEYAPKADFDRCMAVNRFPFVLKVVQENGLNYLKQIAVDEMNINFYTEDK